MPGMSRLYHDSVYTPTPVPSYWEAGFPERPEFGRPLDGDKECDVAIVGGGYTGLSAALHLARDFGMNVCLLEAGPIAWGASGRNGGFNCLPATKMPVQQMIRTYGLEATQEFWKVQLAGSDFVGEIAEQEQIELDRQGNGNLEVAHRPEAFKGLRSYGEEIKRHFGIDSELYSRSEFDEVGYQSVEQYGALKIKAGYGINPLKLSLGLARAATNHGARLFPDSRVIAWQKEAGQHVLKTAGGQIRAVKVLMATNGFTQEGMHGAFDGRLLPVLSNIITTRPLTDDELKAHNWQVEEPICNTRNLLFYFRLLKDRSFLLGARGDWTGKPEDGAKMKAWMQMRLGEVFPHWRDVEITHFWRGLVCMSRKLAPSLGCDREDDSLFYAYGFHANGVNTAPWSGRAMARLMAGQEGAAGDIPKVMRGQASKFPLPFLRILYLRAAAAIFKWQDD